MVKTVSFTLIVLLAAYLARKKETSVVPTVGEEPTKKLSDFSSPYYYTNAGVPDSSSVLNGGDTYKSVVNIQVNPDLAQYMDRKYMPLFGFVGVSA